MTDIEIMRRALDRENDTRRPPNMRHWEFHAVGATRDDVKRLVDQGYVCVSTRDRTITKYILTDKGRNIVWAESMERQFEAVSVSEVTEALELIVGFDDIKLTIAEALASRRKINFMLEGPPACAKSVILDGIRSIVPSSYQAFGSRTSAAGLSEVLFELHPNVLLLDEADKMRHDVYSVLLGLMESGEILETKSKKALRNGTQVYTPKGPRPIETLAVGDLVYGIDGNAVPVLGVFPQGEQDIYEVNFSDEQVLPCTLEHLWEIERSNVKPKVIETSELLQISPRLLSRTWVPVVETVRFPFQPVPLDAYALGAFISNGGLTREVLVLSTTEGTFDDPVLARVAAVAPEGYSFKRTGGGGYDFSLTRDERITGRHPWISALRELGLWGKYSHEKFIPSIYKYNSEEVRWALIQGLMDTDGFVGSGKYDRQPRTSTSSARLADDIAEVVESLGGICAITVRPASYLNRKTGLRVPCKPAYVVRITHPDATKFFQLERKRSLCRKKVKPMRRYINSVRFVGRDEATCIEVDHPRQLFLAEGFVPTHNTRGIKLETTVIAACNSSKKMSPEFLSRFAFHPHFPEYSRDEFIDVVIGMLARREGCPEDIARTIGIKVYDMGLGDVRKARGVWQIMREPTEAEVERVIQMNIKYGPRNDNRRRKQPRGSYRMKI
ncbi:MAG TPA: LAGLIDADG family homing endonuclease [Dehalococcoidia bacterium]|nr:LAGLIDADG family homing endonuclease [Dehalococcoidia bacterium]